MGSLWGVLGLSAFVGGPFLCPLGLSAVPGLVQLSGLIHAGDVAMACKGFYSRIYIYKGRGRSGPPGAFKGVLWPFVPGLAVCRGCLLV